jgi:hypothetical protein
MKRVQVKKDSYDLLKELDYEAYWKAVDVAACIITNVERSLAVTNNNEYEWRYEIERAIVGHTLSIIEKAK